MAYIYSNPAGDAAGAFQGGANVLGETILRMAMLKHQQTQQAFENQNQLAQMARQQSNQDRSFGLQEREARASETNASEARKFRENSEKDLNIYRGKELERQTTRDTKTDEWHQNEVGRQKSHDKEQSDYQLRGQILRAAQQAMQYQTKTQPKPAVPLSDNIALETYGKLAAAIGAGDPTWKPGQVGNNLSNRVQQILAPPGVQAPMPSGQPQVQPGGLPPNAHVNPQTGQVIVPGPNGGWIDLKTGQPIK